MIAALALAAVLTATGGTIEERLAEQAAPDWSSGAETVCETEPDACFNHLGQVERVIIEPPPPGRAAAPARRPFVFTYHGVPRNVR